MSSELLMHHMVFHSSIEDYTSLSELMTDLLFLHPVLRHKLPADTIEEMYHYHR